LYTGPGPWQNNRTLHDLLDEPAEFHGFVPQWGPLFWELSSQTADQLLSSGEEWQQTLAVLRAQGEEGPAFERVYVEAMRRLEGLADQDQVRWYDLMRIILSWALWRRPRIERPTLLAAAQATQVNVRRQREVELMGQTIGEAIWEEGRVAGELRQARRILQRLLADRFGSVPEAIVQSIEASSDVERLTTAALQVSRIARPEDLSL
jgi:hypothetical protein